MTASPTCGYQPRAKARDIIHRSWDHVSSVPYQVSLRWVFYRLLQDGVFHNKQDYKTLSGLLAKARKSFYGEWRPGTLADESRKTLRHRIGSHPDYSPEDEIMSLADCLDFRVDHFHHQEWYTEVWFEAKAMISQFEHYADGITLRPFGGDPSVPFKWQAAQGLAEMARLYDKPVVVLYYGDLDDKGQQIYQSALTDISQWCNVDFHFEYCGLTDEQVERFGVPEDPDRPGKYQWEALTDTQAGEIIKSTTSRWVDKSIIEQTDSDSWRLVEKWRSRVQNALRQMLAEQTE